MKKRESAISLTAALLIVVLLLSVLLVSPVTYGNAAELENDDALVILQKLGIMEFDEDVDAAITRGELFAVLSGILGDDSVSVPSIPFTDINEQHPYYAGIARAYALGLVSGYPDGTIRADESVTYEQAIWLCAVMLGYQPLIDNGMKIEQMVSDTKILRGVQITDATAMTKGEMGHLLFNVVTSDRMIDVLSIGENNEYKVSDQTILGKYKHIYETTGVISGNDDTYLTQNMAAPNGTICVEGELYGVGDSDVKDLLGQNVTMYYQQYEDEDMGTVLYAYSYNTTVKKVSAKDIDKLEGMQLHYFDGDKAVTAHISQNVDVLYNNAPALPFTPADVMPKNGTVALIDNDNDGVVDVIITEEYQPCVVESIDVFQEIIYPKFGGAPLAFEDYDKVVFVDRDNQPMYLTELSEWDVLNVMVGRGSNRKIKILYAPNEVFGTVTEVIHDDEFMVTIEGESYGVSDFYQQSGQKAFEIGMTGTFSLDERGEIICVKENTGAKQFGYLIASAISGGLEKTIDVKLMDKSGTASVKKVAQRMEIDGYSYSLDNADIEILKQSLVPGVIVYELNANDEVVYVDTSTRTERESEDTLEKFYTGYQTDDSGKMVALGEPIRYKSTSKIFQGKVAAQTATALMLLPDTASLAADEDYTVVGLDYLINDRFYSIDAYKINKDAIAADVVVMYQPTGTATALALDTGITVIDKLTQVLDSEGENTYKMYGYTLDVYQEAIFKDSELVEHMTINGEPYVPSAGDVIRYNTDRNGAIIACELVYSARLDQLTVPNPSQDNYAHNCRIQLANVYKKSGSNMMITRHDLVPGTDYDFTAADVETTSQDLYSIYVFDTKTGKLSTGVPDDVVGYVNTGGTAYSRAIFQDRFGDPRMMIIYK